MIRKRLLILVGALFFTLAIALVVVAQRSRRPSPVPSRAPVQASDEWLCCIPWAEAAERFNREKGPVAAILLGADKVETFRIEPSMEMRQGIDGQKVLYKAKPLDKELSVRLATSLLDPKSYISPGWDAKLCAFQPRAALRFWKGEQFLDVLFCFDCQQLMVVERDPSVPLRSLGGLEARFRVGGDFEPIERDLQEVMKKVFADDPDLARIIGRR